jgi:hypothetical protein
VAERLMAPVLKTGIPERVSGVRIPPSPPYILYSTTCLAMIPLDDTQFTGGKTEPRSQSHQARPVTGRYHAVLSSRPRRHRQLAVVVTLVLLAVQADHSAKMDSSHATAAGSATFPTSHPRNAVVVVGSANAMAVGRV